MAQPALLQPLGNTIKIKTAATENEIWRFFTFPRWLAVCTLLNVKWYELHSSDDDTRDTFAVSRYFLLLWYTAVYRDLGDTGIVV